MSKHAGPWFLNQYGQLLDGAGAVICNVETRDPETRAVLLHAAEMWEALRDVRALRLQNSIECHHGFTTLEEAIALAGKIEAEIAKGNPMILVDAKIKNWKVTTEACPIGRKVCSGQTVCGHFDGWHGPDDGEIEVRCLAKDDDEKRKKAT